MSEKISNNRLIYAITDFLTKDQIEDVIQDAIDQAGIKDKFDVSVIFYKGKMCKYSYIWTSTDTLFNFLTKFDSTQTITHSVLSKSDSEIVKESTVVGYKTNSDLCNNKFGLLDMTVEDEHNEIIKSNFEIRNVKITLKSVKYSDEKLKQLIIEDPKYTNKECVIKFKPALFQPIDDETDFDKRVHNVWYADKVPKHITVKSLVDLLKKFVTNPTKKAPVKFSKNKQLVSYPHINMKDSPSGKKVWVTFDPDSHDGEAALFMCKQLQVGNIKIYFNHFKDMSRDDDDEEIYTSSEDD